MTDNKKPPPPPSDDRGRTTTPDDLDHQQPTNQFMNFFDADGNFHTVKFTNAETAMYIAAMLAHSGHMPIISEFGDTAYMMTETGTHKIATPRHDHQLTIASVKRWRDVALSNIGNIQFSIKKSPVKPKKLVLH